MRQSYLRFLPAFVWMLFIFYLSSRSTAGIPLTGTNRFLLLKTFHLIEYTVLTVFLNFGHYDLKKNFALSYAYALSDEFHQTFVPGREGKLVDTFIDMIGISIGTLISYFLNHYRMFKKLSL